MGVVSDSDFESQLQNVTNPKVNAPVILPIIPGGNAPITSDNSVKDTAITGELVNDEPARRGRKAGDNNVPSGLRALIAGAHATEGRQAALSIAREFGVSPSSASAYANGVTSTTSYNGPKKQDIIDFVKQRKARVTKKALRVMTSAIDNITDDKLESADAKDLAVIAKNMGSIVADMADTNQANINNNGVNFVIFAPPVMKEEQYGAISTTE